MCPRTPQTGRPGGPCPERDGGASRPYCMRAGPAARATGQHPQTSSAQDWAAQVLLKQKARKRLAGTCHAGPRAGRAA